MIEKKKFGTTKNGKEVTLYILKNKNGMEAHVSDYGALLINLLVPDREGKLVDVVLGFDTLEEYESRPSFYGATIGRVGNRIAEGKFTLNGVKYEIPVAFGRHLLHSGSDGYQKRMWNAETDEEDGACEVTFFMQSPDGDQGFPGNLDVEVTYTLTDENELMINYYGLSDKDTLFNMTNHSYFNLNGEGSGDVHGHKLQLLTDSYTPADDTSIPFGNIDPVEGTPFDFREEKTIGQDIYSDFHQTAVCGGYDHNFIINGGEVQENAELVGVCKGDKTGIVMEIYSDLPAMQMFSNNGKRVSIGKKGHEYGEHAAVCFETQFVPDAINHPNFAQPVIKANEEFVSLTVYRFCVE